MLITLISVVGWAVCLLVGISVQRRIREPDRLTHILFIVSLWVATPLLVFFSLSTLALHAGLVTALAVTVAASWLMVGVGMLWAGVGGRESRERGVLALATSMGNTGSLGYPLVLIVFGPQGLALAVVFSVAQFLIPSLAVALGIARRFAGPGSYVADSPGLGAMVRNWLFNAPVAAGALAVVLRLLNVDLSQVVAPMGTVVGVGVGMLGFLQVGIATPLGRLAYGRGDFWRAALTITLRCGAAPLVLYLLGLVTGVNIPAVFLLLAAMPVAFNTMVLARVCDLEAGLARLLIVVSTFLVIVGVLVWQIL